MVEEFYLEPEEKFYLQEMGVFFQLVEELFFDLQLVWVEFELSYLQLVVESS